MDNAVVHALYEEHEGELRRFLLGLLRDPQQANDVLQATFAKVITQGHTSQPQTRKAWLFRVAYHEAMGVLRRRSTGERIVRQLNWADTTTQEGADASLLRDETVAAVRGAIEALPPEQRRVVRMRIYDEKTFAQIATELEIPLGTALARMRAALEKMRLRLDDAHDP